MPDLKLILKKAVFAMLYVALAIVVMIVAMNFIMNAFFGVAVAVLVLGIISFKLRLRRGDIEKPYLKLYESERPTLFDDVKYLLKMPEVWVELVIAAVIVIGFLKFAVRAPEVGFFIKLLTGAIVTVVLTAVFAVADLVLWLLVFRKWRNY